MRVLGMAVVSLWLVWTASGQPVSEKLATGVRIEVQQGGAWRRAIVSEDSGPSASTIKVRLDPNNEFAVVPRKSIRAVPAPASIKVGDRVEWYSTSTYEWLPATVTGLGSGSMAGMYLMTADKYPKSSTYTKAENLRVLGAAGASTAAASNSGPALGKYGCRAYGAAGRPPIYLGAIELKAGGVYTATAGSQGRYTVDEKAGTITWSGGWMQENHFAGKMDGNATIRIASTSVCTHE